MHNEPNISQTYPNHVCFELLQKNCSILFSGFTYLILVSKEAEIWKQKMVKNKSIHHVLDLVSLFYKGTPADFDVPQT